MSIAAGLIRCIRATRFGADIRGNVSIFFALALFPITAGVGAAVDYSRANGVKSQLQAALDAAVLAGAGDTTTNQNNTAKNTFDGNFVPKISGVTSSPSFQANADGTYTGTATASVPTSLLGVVHVNALNVSVTSTAAVASKGSNPLCLIALNLTAQSAFDYSGSAAVNASNCTIQVNSNHAKAVTLSGSAKINSKENCFVGKSSTSGSAAISPAPDAVCKAMKDPYASMALPSVGACDYTDYKPANNETLQPGVYCKGLKISSASVTFAPGLYVIKDGLLQSSGGSTMNGNGVSFFLTGNGAGMQTSGGSSWHLVAMSTGELKGFVFFLDPSSTPASNSELSGTSELYFEGVLYFARQMLKLSGGSTAYATAPFTSYIADTFDLSGSSNLNINNDVTKTSVPIPSPVDGSNGGYLRLIY